MSSPLLPIYARADLAFERGEGVWLVARDGERYLDFGAGIAVNVLGHAHPHLVQALTEQAANSGTPPTFTRPGGGSVWRSASSDNTFADVAFFTNSGAEALEGRHQDSPEIPLRPGGAGAIPHHPDLRGRFPRPDSGDHRGGRPTEVPRRVRPQGRGLRSGLRSAITRL